MIAVRELVRCAWDRKYGLIKYWPCKFVCSSQKTQTGQVYMGNCKTGRFAVRSKNSVPNGPGCY